MYYEKSNIYINEDYMVLFNLNNYDIFQIDDEHLNIITKLNSLNSIETNDLTSKELEVYNLLFKNNIQPINNIIENVKIHVSNACNLKCNYCYANCGNYGTPDSLMSLSLAKQICRFIKSNIPQLKNITFFGGEPLLALDQIEFICNEFKDMNVKFLLQTNGTILNDRIINLLNNFNIKITVSLDGPKDINDLNRVDKNNTGTHDLIINNIKSLNMNTNNGVSSIQGTYTETSRNKYSRSDIIKYLQKISNAKFIKLQDVFSDNNTLKISESDSFSKNHLYKILDFLNKDKLLVDDDVTNLLTYFFSKRKYNDNFCEASKNTITIDSSGNIWPCQLFVNNDHYYMGNITDTLSNHEFKKVYENLTSLKKSTDIDCKKCIARFYCTRCTGMSCILKNQSIENFKSFGVNCNYRKQITFDTLNLLSQYINENKFHDFNDNFLKSLDI